MSKFLNSAASTGVLLLLAILLFGLPTWIPLFRNVRAPAPRFRFALIVTEVGQFLQFVCVAELARNAFELDVSRYFACLGIPLAGAGGAVALLSAATEREKRAIGCAVTAGLTALMWLFLISAH